MMRAAVSPTSYNLGLSIYGWYHYTTLCISIALKPKVTEQNPPQATAGWAEFCQSDEIEQATRVFTVQLNHYAKPWVWDDLFGHSVTYINSFLIAFNEWSIRWPISSRG